MSKLYSLRFTEAIKAYHTHIFRFFPAGSFLPFDDLVKQYDGDIDALVEGMGWKYSNMINDPSWDQKFPYVMCFQEDIHPMKERTDSNLLSIIFLCHPINIRLALTLLQARLYCCSNEQDMNNMMYDAPIDYLKKQEIPTSIEVVIHSLCKIIIEYKADVPWINNRIPQILCWNLDWMETPMVLAIKKCQMEEYNKKN